jgi:membrane protein
METPLDELLERVNRFVWDRDLRGLTGSRRFAFETLRVIYVVVRELARGELNLRAMSLVYTTLLSMVPLLAVSFSVLKAFGVHRQIRPTLIQFLEPLGDKGTELAENIVAFVEKVDVGVLGTVGLLLLIYTVISLAKKIEGALNYVWRIEGSRSFAQRFGNFLGFLLLGPLVVLATTGITASLMSMTVVRRIGSIEPFGTLIVFSGKLVPYLLIWLAFVLIYRFVPNARVRLGVAIVGGLIAAILWQSTGLVFATFIASSARYAAIYSSFAILILALIWLYLSWLILLIGGQISFLVQHPRYLTMRPVRVDLSNRIKERLALTIMYLVGHHYYRHRAPWTMQRLVDHLELPSRPVFQLLELLRAQGYLEQTGDDPPAYLPARAIETIDLVALVDAVRRAEESSFLRAEGMLAVEPVDEVFDRMRAAVSGTLAGLSLRDLVLAGSAEEPDPGEEDGGNQEDG